MGVILHARGDERSKESGSPIPDTMDPEDYARRMNPSNGDGADTEAETEIEFGDTKPEAPPSSHRVAQTKVPTKTDCGGKQPEALDGYEPVVLPQLYKNRRRILGTTQPNTTRTSRRTLMI